MSDDGNNGFCLSSVVGLAGSVIVCVFEHCWNPTEKQILYLVRYRSNLVTFETRARELEALQKDVLLLVHGAEKKGEVIKAEVLNWQVETMKIEKQVKCLQEKIEKSTKGCYCHTWCLDWCSRHKLSRRALKKSNAIDVLLSKGYKFDNNNVSFPAHPADLRSLPTPDFVPLETSMKAINLIIDGLKEEKNKITGVHGSEGIGKTTLMKQVVKQVHFDKVLLVKVTQTPNLEKIQDDILLGLLDLRFKELMLNTKEQLLGHKD